ncbi:MAG: hypothetical protein LBL13_10500 [Bacteroidales bacterium]|jgi:hypothetical protein|nr:hypothetical protein [Bacteroidales bacterium]
MDKIMRSRINLTIITLFITAGTAFSQSKHTLSSGAGKEHFFNGMMLALNFSGKSFNIDYDYEKYMKHNWKTFLNVNLAGAPSLNLSENFPVKPYYDTRVIDIDVNLNTVFLKKIFEKGNFSFHTGFISSLQYNYNYLKMKHKYEIIEASQFYEVSTSYSVKVNLSEGIATALRLKWKQFTFQDITSCLLFAACLHPNYADDNPIYNNGNFKDYFVLATINQRNCLTNKFKVEIPLNMKGKSAKGLAITHNLRYEHSTIKDNIFHRFSNIFYIGIIFGL